MDDTRVNAAVVIWRPAPMSDFGAIFGKWFIYQARSPHCMMRSDPLQNARTHQHPEAK